MYNRDCNDLISIALKHTLLVYIKMRLTGKLIPNGAYFI